MRTFAARYDTPPLRHVAVPHFSLHSHASAEAGKNGWQLSYMQSAEARLPVKYCSPAQCARLHICRSKDTNHLCAHSMGLGS